MSASAPPLVSTVDASFDVLVIGAGPAGANAAMSAAAAGLSVGLIDEAEAAGGQVWRAPPVDFIPQDRKLLGPDFADGQAMRTALAASNVTCLFGRRVWDVRQGFTVFAVGTKGYETFSANALVTSPGTFERVVPFKNSTLPGIIGLGAATVLLKAQAMLPGKATVVAGTGPLLVAVAIGILNAGGTVAAVVDLNGPLDYARTLPAMTNRPDLLLRGAAWMARLRAAGIPYYFSSTLIEARGTDCVTSVVIAPVRADGSLRSESRIKIACDAVAVGHGLTPSTEMSRALGAEHRFDAEHGEWVAMQQSDGATNVPGLYIAGDASGVHGAAAAALAGKQAGWAAAGFLGALAPAKRDSLIATSAEERRRASRFGRAMTRLTRLKPGLIAAMAPETVVCRCEDQTRADIDAASRDGAQAIGQLKAWTRCGMGPCQGRICGEIVGSLMALNGLPREQYGQMVARPPLRPVHIAALSGQFQYEDIVLPASLPSS